MANLKRVLKESKACQIFRKTNFSYFLIHTPACAYQGVRNVHFRKSWGALFSCNTRFEIHPFALLPTSCAVNQHWDFCLSEGGSEGQFDFEKCNHQDFLNIYLIEFHPLVIAIQPASLRTFLFQSRRLYIFFPVRCSEWNKLPLNFVYAKLVCRQGMNYSKLTNLFLNLILIYSTLKYLNIYLSPSQYR